MSVCDRCGNYLEDPRDKNSAGHWRDACLPCIEAEVAEYHDPGGPPIEATEEYREWVRQK